MTSPLRNHTRGARTTTTVTGECATGKKERVDGVRKYGGIVRIEGKRAEGSGEWRGKKDERQRTTRAKETRGESRADKNTTIAGNGESNGQQPYGGCFRNDRGSSSSAARHSSIPRGAVARESPVRSIYRVALLKSRPVSSRRESKYFRQHFGAIFCYLRYIKISSNRAPNKCYGSILYIKRRDTHDPRKINIKIFLTEKCEHPFTIYSLGYFLVFY